MNHYSAAIRKHLFNPQNVGDLSNPTVTGRAGAFTCGAAMCIDLLIDEQQQITDARFRAAGCAFLIASASVITDRVKGKTTAEAAAFAHLVESAVLDALGDVPVGRHHCVALACQTMIDAIKSYSDSARLEWSGDDALICTCFCVSERTIEHAIRDRNLRTIAEVTKACNAGAGCRSCYSLIEDILGDQERQRDWEVEVSI